MDLRLCIFEHQGIAHVHLLAQICRGELSRLKACNATRLGLPETCVGVTGARELAPLKEE